VGPSKIWEGHGPPLESPLRPWLAVEWIRASYCTATINLIINY